MAADFSSPVRWEISALGFVSGPLVCLVSVPLRIACFPSAVLVSCFVSALLAASLVSVLLAASLVSVLLAARFLFVPPLVHFVYSVLLQLVACYVSYVLLSACFVCSVPQLLRDCLVSSLFCAYFVWSVDLFRAGKIFSVPLATMEPFPKNQSPNWNQDIKPGRQSRTPKRTVAKRCKKKKTREPIHLGLVKNARHYVHIVQVKYLQKLKARKQVLVHERLSKGRCHGHGCQRTRVRSPMGPASTPSHARMRTLFSLPPAFHKKASQTE